MARTLRITFDIHGVPDNEHATPIDVCHQIMDICDELTAAVELTAAEVPASDDDAVYRLINSLHEAMTGEVRDDGTPVLSDGTPVVQIENTGRWLDATTEGA